MIQNPWGYMVQRRAEKRERERGEIVAKLDRGINRLEAEIARIEGTPILSEEELTDREYVQAHYRNLAGMTTTDYERDPAGDLARRLMIPVLQKYTCPREPETVISPEEFQTIQRESLVSNYQGDRDLFARTRDVVQTSKKPKREYRKLQKYFNKLQRYYSDRSQFGNCGYGCLMPTLPPPQPF